MVLGKDRFLCYCCSCYGTPQTFLIIPLDQSGETKEITLDDRWHYLALIRANAGQLWQPDEAIVTMLVEDAESGETAIVRFNPKSCC
jgi:hypothetical protein